MDGYDYNKDFPEPDKKARIWRYLDLSKFIYLIDKKSLYFSRQDILSKEDPFEGYTPRPYLEEMAKCGGAESLEDIEMIVDAVKNAKKYTFVNCWHLSEYESSAMWKLYLKCDEGVAIQSTYENLRDCFDSPNQKIDLAVGPIKYIDYGKYKLPNDNILMPAFYKWICHEYEKELRASFQKLPIKNGYLYNPDLNNPARDDAENEIDYGKEVEDGIEIPVKLNKLIESIYISPYAPIWFEDVVRSLCTKYKVKKEVKLSILTSRLYKL